LRNLSAFGSTLQQLQDGDVPCLRLLWCETQGEGCALQRLDARGNCLGALQDLAVLAACPRLQELSLQGAPPAPRRACLPGGHVSCICR